MPSLKTARGRPKGTGRDDRGLLQSLIQLVDANPDLKPTTAIKSMGVTDPSAIRRLRDKYNVVRTAPPLAVVAKRPAAASQPARVSRAVALKLVPEPKRSATPQQKPRADVSLARTVSQERPAKDLRAAEASAQADPGPQVAPARPPNWFSLWTEFGLQSMAASLQVQWYMYQQVWQSPTVTAALGGQAMLTDFAALWCAYGPETSTTVH